MRSIERTLLAWILCALTLGTLLVTWVSYLVTLDEMNEVFDEQLRNVAEAVAHYQAGRPAAAGSVPMPAPSGELRDTDIVTFAWSPQGQLVYTSDPRVPMPFTRTAGLANPMVGSEPWIVHTVVHAGGVAQAGQPLWARRTMAAESAAAVVPPLIGLVVVVGALLVLGMRRGLRPLAAATREMGARGVRTLEPLATVGQPRELLPMVQAVNALMARLGMALTQQRQFVADAAHELRTPITALKLQLQWLERATSAADQARARAELAAGIERAQHLVEQLLLVARMEPEGEQMRPEPLDLAAAAREAVARFSAQADAAGIDLGALAPRPVPTHADRAAVAALLDNLIDNALRYTPRGGTVDVEARLAGVPGACAAPGTDRGAGSSAPAAAAAAWLIVRDDGPGIAPAERERVFDRFFRGERALACAVPGSGLGLAIVRAIARRHGGSVELATPTTGQGLEVQVQLGPAS